MPLKTKSPKTPECDKLVSVSKDSQIIGEFLAWADERNIRLCQLVEDEDGVEYQIVQKIEIDPENKEEKVALKLMDKKKIVRFKTVEEKLAAYFDIDLDLVEKERRALLDHIRKGQK
jgi:hypothetical protein